VLAVLTLPGVVGADPQSPDSLRRANANLETKSRAAVLSLYSLDSRLASAQARLADLRAQMERLRRERASLGRQLGVARSGMTISQRRLATRLRMLYEQDGVSTIEIVLGSENLDDALNGLESLDRVVSQDEAVLAELKTAQRKLHTATRSLAARAVSLQRATEAAAATAASLEQAKAARSAYISQLAEQRSLNSAAITRLEAQASAATERSQGLAGVPAEADTVATTAFGAAPAGGTITVSATGYSLSGQTASGLPVGWGVAAVDPSVIPLGTHMTIPGYGDAVAADTGGAVVGSSIDLWFPSTAQAQAWGRRTVTISLR
jgi:3D (Asp-Asp-Asp) domain-containing protein